MSDLFIVGYKHRNGRIMYYTNPKGEHFPICGRDPRKAYKFKDMGNAIAVSRIIRPPKAEAVVYTVDGKRVI